jgi:nitrogen regulatory protein P-II 1
MPGPKNRLRCHINPITGNDIETYIRDSSAKEIVHDLLSIVASESEPRGMIFVKEVSNDYEIGTKKSGDAILTTQ